MRRLLPPDPEGMNDIRAEWAEKSLLLLVINTGVDWADALPDLLCNLMHLADRDQEMNFAAALDCARLHYNAETGGAS